MRNDERGMIMAENLKREPKALDPYSEEYQKAKLEDLVYDAIARKDKKAFEWLNTESAKKDERVRKGVKTKVARNIAAIRAEYAKKFLGYKTNSKRAAEAARKRKQEKAEQERLALFDEASKFFQ